MSTPDLKFLFEELTLIAVAIAGIRLYNEVRDLISRLDRLEKHNGIFLDDGAQIDYHDR